jgi:hypothetical protein
LFKKFHLDKVVNIDEPGKYETVNPIGAFAMIIFDKLLKNNIEKLVDIKKFLMKSEF